MTAGELRLEAERGDRSDWPDRAERRVAEFEERVAPTRERAVEVAAGTTSVLQDRRLAMSDSVTTIGKQVVDAPPGENGNDGTSKNGRS